MESTIDKELTQLTARLQQAWNSGDGAAFAEAFWDDAWFTVFDGWSFVGADAIRKDHQHAFAGPRKGSTSVFTVERAALLNPDTAIANVVAVIDDAPGFSERPPERFVAVPRLVATRRNGEWRISMFTNMLYQPIPPAHHPDNNAVQQLAQQSAAAEPHTPH